MLMQDSVQLLIRDDGSSKNITLIDKKNIHSNCLQVLHQYAVSRQEGAKHDGRLAELCSRTAKKKLGVIEKLRAFFEKYFGIGGSSSFTE